MRIITCFGDKTFLIIASISRTKITRSHGPKTLWMFSTVLHLLAYVSHYFLTMSVSFHLNLTFGIAVLTGWIWVFYILFSFPSGQSYEYWRLKVSTVPCIYFYCLFFLGSLNSFNSSFVRLVMHGFVYWPCLGPPLKFLFRRISRTPQFQT